MASYRLNLLGQEVSFKTNADDERIREAERLIKDRYDGLNDRGSRLSNEKLLILVALSLADELIQTNQRLGSTEEKIDQLLQVIDDATN
ncbi:MAG: cell division protein ZapA [Desulfohalobiaceae bacterium]|nr:cell division protein ZapA [Desulfohalobiaceae bacterium]